MSRSLVSRTASSLFSRSRGKTFLIAAGICSALLTFSSSNLSASLAIVTSSGGFAAASAYAFHGTPANGYYRGRSDVDSNPWGGMASASATGTTIDKSNYAGDEFGDIIYIDNSAWAHASGEVYFPQEGDEFDYGGIEYYSVYAYAETSVENDAEASASGGAYIDILILEDVYFSYGGTPWQYGNGGILLAGYYSLSVSVDGSGEEWSSLSIWAIPEPASLSILAIGGLALLRRRAS